jgi:hypothetical protein
MGQLSTRMSELVPVMTLFHREDPNDLVGPTIFSSRPTRCVSRLIGGR